MAQISIKVSLDIDLDGYRAEYGDERYSLQEIRERIAYDVADALRAASYAHAIREVGAK